MMQTQLVKKTAIIDSGDFNLSAARYLEKVEINSEFEIKKLNEIIDIVRDKPENFDGSKKYFSTGNVSNDHIGDKFQLIEFNNKPSRANILPKKGDVGFAKMKNTNKVVIIDDLLEGSIFSTGFCFIRAKESVYPDYLYHLMKDKRFQEKKNELTSDGIMGAIRQNDILNIEIPLPPLEIQEQIVKEIERYQQIIDGCRLVVENYKPVINIDPSWKKIKLDDLAKLKYGLGESAKNQGTHRFIRITDIDASGLLNDNDKKYVSIDHSHSEYILSRGDLLIARTGATYGKCLYFDSDDQSVFAGYLIKISLNQNVLPKYFWIFSQSSDFDSQKKRLVTGGGQPQFNANSLKKLIVPVPTIEEQYKIVDEVNSEQMIIESNKELIMIYENKINARINKLWSDN